MGRCVGFWLDGCSLLLFGVYFVVLVLVVWLDLLLSITQQ